MLWAFKLAGNIGISFLEQTAKEMNMVHGTLASQWLGNVIWS